MERGRGTVPGGGRAVFRVEFSIMLRVEFREEFS